MIFPCALRDTRRELTHILSGLLPMPITTNRSTLSRLHRDLLSALADYVRALTGEDESAEGIY